jgi:hypothetical protein
VRIGTGADQLGSLTGVHDPFELRVTLEHPLEFLGRRPRPGADLQTRPRVPHQLVSHGHEVF